MAEDADVIVDDDDDFDENEIPLFPYAWMLAIALGFGIAITIASGYYIGHTLGFRNAHDTVCCISLWCTLLAVVATLRGVISIRCWPEARAGLLLLLFMFITEGFGFPWWFGSERGVIVNVAWLTPLLVGCLVLPRRRFWIASIACWQLLLAASIASGYDMTHWWSGISFFSGWMS